MGRNFSPSHGRNSQYGPRGAIASQATKTESDMAGARARAGQLHIIGQAARAAKSARARAPADWIDPSAVAFQIIMCGRRKEKCMAARA
jgi:hypothetical protein